MTRPLDEEQEDNNMESTEKTVSNKTGQFRKCVYPYCRNMAMATDDYCVLHQHSKLLVKHVGKKNPPKKVIKVAAKVMAKALATPAPAKKVLFLVTVQAISKTFQYYYEAESFIKDMMQVQMTGIKFDKVVI
jgi:hypothetical protein